MSLTTNNSTDATPQQIGKAFVVQYYRLLHEHPELLHRFYSSSSTFMHDDPNQTVIGIENISKRIEELSLKQRHVKIRQVDCHSTVGSSVVVQVCGEMSSAAIEDKNQIPIMKRFVQTFVLAPTENVKQKYYVHNDIFRYQDNPITSPERKTIPVQTPITPSSIVHIEFSANAVTKNEEESEENTNETTNTTSSITNVNQQEKEQSTKPKSYRDAIGKKEKITTTNENTQSTAAASTTTESKTKKSGKKKSKSANKNARTTHGHTQDTNDYYDDSWYYPSGEEGYLLTGYTDDQEIFVGNLSTQITEQQIHELFRSYGHLLLVRIGNTGSQVGPANFAFVVCQSIDMAKAIVADRDKFLKNHQINVEAKKRRPFPHTFRPTYPTAASPTNYQSTGYPAAYYKQSSSAAAAPFYDGGVSGRGGKRGGKGGTH